MRKDRPPTCKRNRRTAILRAAIFAYYASVAALEAELPKARLRCDDRIAPVLPLSCAMTDPRRH